MSNSLSFIILWSIHFPKEAVIIHSSAFSGLFSLVMGYYNNALNICTCNSNFLL